VVLPTRAVIVAAAIRSYGYSDYRELRASVGAARTLPVAAGRRVAVGMRLDYHSVNITEFGNRSAFDLAGGLQVEITPTTAAGLALRNALAIARPDSVELRTPLGLSPVMVVGATLRPVAMTTLALDVEKDLDFPAMLRAGVEFRPMQPASLRLGAALPLAGAGTARMAFGAGFDLGSLVVDAAVDWHVVLGPSPAVSVTATF
jgi:hypothetical protein